MCTMKGHQGSITDGHDNTIWIFKDGRIYLEIKGKPPVHVADIIDGEYRLKKITMHPDFYAVAFYSSTVIYLSPKTVSVVFRPPFHRKKYWMTKQEWESVRLQQFKTMDFSHQCYIYVKDFKQKRIK